jgi:hypothetical protein
MKKFALLSALAILASACTAGVPAEDESIEGLSDAISSGCNTNSGVNPTKASLAVAMATELKRWEPVTDLMRKDSNGHVTVELSAAGISRCSAMGSSCANTKAILALQSVDVNQVIHQGLFNATTFRTDLVSSFDRQTSRTNDLKKNWPAQVPAAHTLTKVGGPTNLGIGACGPHYLFRPTTPTGGTYPNPGNLINNLYFFGEPNNDFLSFQVLNNKADVGIDPIDGDNSPPTTTSGTCPTYELDRVYNPDNSLNGKCCVTVGAVNGALQPVPRATGYLGCKGGAVPTR